MINFYNYENADSSDLEEVLIRAAEAVLSYHSLPDNTELTIALESINTIQKLNNDFLQINEPTDVLSFPSDEFDPDTQSTYIGDVVISKEIAAKQAESAGHGLICEMQLLVIHGVLHLLGYDHAIEPDKNKMWAVQKIMLESLNCNIQKYPE